MKSLLWVTTALLVSATVMGADARGRFSASQFALELEGGETALVRSVSGGGADSEVITFQSGSDTLVKKHIGRPKYGEFTFQVSPDSGPELTDWIEASFNGTPTQKDGVFSVLDFNLRARQRAEFYNALITEITFPASDASSKDPAYLAVKIDPEVSNFENSGAPISANVTRRQKSWNPANFRLDLNGLATRRVQKIDAFTIKQKFTEAEVGESRDYIKIPGRIEYPNLTLRISQSDIDSWLVWYEDFIVKGNNGDDQEKSGALTFLSANLAEEIGVIELHGVGLKRFTPLPAGATSDRAPYFEVELYVENMKLRLGPGPVPQ